MKPALGTGGARRFRQPGAQARPRARGGGQLGIEALVVSAHEITDRPFEFGHPGAAIPAICQVLANLCGPMICEFAIGGEEQLLVRGMQVV